MITELDFDLEEFINAHITFVPNIDKGRFKEQMVEIDILVDAGDMNYDFTLNSFGNGFYNNPEEGNFDEKSSLVWLCKQQGISESELFHVMTGGTLLPENMAKVEGLKDHYEKKLGEYGYDVFNHNHHKGKFAEFYNIYSKIAEADKKLKAATKRYIDNDISYEEFYAKNPNVPKVPTEKFDELKSKCLRNAVESQISLQNKIEELNKNIKEDPELLGIDFVFEIYNQHNDDYNKLKASEPVFLRQKFVESVLNESENTTSHMNALTFLVKMPLGEAMEINKLMKEEFELNDFYDAEKRTGLSTITLSKDSAAGLYDPWGGSGGVFEIELVKDVVLPVKYIHCANTADYMGYSVNSIFGGMDYVESLVSIDKVNVKEIDELIINAFMRSEKETAENTKEKLYKETEDKEI